MSAPRAAGCRECPEPDHRTGRRGDEAQSCQAGSDHTGLLKEHEELLTEERRRELLSRAANGGPRPFPRQAGEEREKVSLGHQPQRGDGEQRRDRGPDRQGGDSKRSRLRNPAADGVASGDVPGNEHRHLGHDSIGESNRRRKVRELLEAVGNLPRLIELRAAERTFPHVRSEGGQTKAPLAVDEEIDLVGK